MKKPNRKRVSSPKNQPKEPDEKKRAIMCESAVQAQGQSQTQEQARDATLSRKSDIPESQGVCRGLHSTKVMKHVTVRTEGTQPPGVMKIKINGENFDEASSEYDAHEVELSRALLMESLSSHLTADCTGTHNAETNPKTWHYSALNANNSSSPTSLCSYTTNSSTEIHNVLNTGKAEVTEPDSDISEIPVTAGAAQFSSKSSARILTGAPGSTETNIHPSLIVQVSFMLIQSLPISTEWSVKPHEKGVTLLLISKTKPHAVQREIDVHISGSLEIIVHRVPLKKDHELWKALPPAVALTESTVDHFMNYMRALVYTMPQYPICAGVSNEQYKEFWPEMTQATIDENEYHELRYTRTCRSLKCDLVVNSQRELRCSSCRSLYNALRLKIKKPPFTFTPGGPTAYSMTKHEIVEKAKVLHGENIKLRETVHRLRCALNRDISLDGSIEQDSYVAYLTTAKRMSFEPKVTPLLRGVFSRDLSMDNSMEQHLQVINVIPAKKISMEPKLTPPAQRTESSPSGQTEAKPDCGNTTVCDTTPLTSVVKKLKQRLQTISHENSSSPSTTPPLSV